MAEAALDNVKFFEANPSHVDKHLTQLWAIMADIKYLLKISARQSTSFNSNNSFHWLKLRFILNQVLKDANELYTTHTRVSTI